MTPTTSATTPYLMTDLGEVEQRYDALSAAIPGLAVFYAMKTTRPGKFCVPWPSAARASRWRRSASCGCCKPSVSTLLE